MGNFVEFIKNNLSHVLPILIVGGFGVAIILERMNALMVRYAMTNQSHFFEKIRDMVMGDRLAEAIAYCDQFRAKPVAQVVRSGLLRAHQPESLVEDALQLSVGESIQNIQKRTAFLSTIANVATLLGLFGTIMGLIQSFEAVGNASAQQRSALLAAGISTAMNATMMGLAVAIPCMIFFSILMNKTNRLSSEIEQSAVKTLDIIKQRHYSAEMGEGHHGKGHSHLPRAV